MSAAISQPLHVPKEAFGQTGVRQFVGPFAALACAVGVAICLSLWARSHTAIDIVEIYHPESRTRLFSAFGRFTLARVAGGGEMPVAWSYSTRPANRTRFEDRWPAGFWKTIGIQALAEQTPRDGTYWRLRVKWPTAAILLAIWPALHAFKAMRKTPVESTRALARPADGYCGRCGRPILPQASSCDCCGRKVARGNA